jgi:hypothetical protein
VIFEPHTTVAPTYRLADRTGPGAEGECDRREFRGDSRRECLDHAIVVNESHLVRLLREVAWTHAAFCHPHRHGGLVKTRCVLPPRDRHRQPRQDPPSSTTG